MDTPIIHLRFSCGQLGDDMGAKERSNFSGLAFKAHMPSQQIFLYGCAGAVLNSGKSYTKYAAPERRNIVTFLWHVSLHHPDLI